MAEYLAVAAIGSTVLGTATQLSANQVSSEATMAESRYKQQVAENNRLTAEQNARYSMAAARTNAMNQDLRTAATLGEQTAAQGASGLDLRVGSPADVRESTARLGRLASEQALQAGALEAYGYRQRATDFGAAAALEPQRRGYGQAARGLQDTSTILSGASSVSDKWLKFKNVGINMDFSGNMGAY